MNTSSQERRFVYEEKCFRFTIFKLAHGERPERAYSGDYQGKEGYVRSQRRGAPVGMKHNEWEDSTREGGPEELLRNLINSGYPWNILGERLMRLDDQFKTVTLEYADIRDSLARFEDEFRDFRRDQGNLKEQVREIVREEIPAMQDRYLVESGLLLAGIAGLGIAILGTPAIVNLLKSHGFWIGPLVIAGVAACLRYRSRKHP